MSGLRWEQGDKLIVAYSGELAIAKITGPHTQKQPRRYRKIWCREDVGTRHNDNRYFTQEAAKASVEATWAGWLTRAGLSTSEAANAEVNTACALVGALADA